MTTHDKRSSAIINYLADHPNTTKNEIHIATGIPVKTLCRYMIDLLEDCQIKHSKVLVRGKWNSTYALYGHMEIRFPQWLELRA